MCSGYLIGTTRRREIKSRRLFLFGGLTNIGDETEVNVQGTKIVGIAQFIELQEKKDVIRLIVQPWGKAKHWRNKKRNIVLAGAGILLKCPLIRF